MLRKYDEKSSLFFVPHVHIQEDAPALFTASVVGLENRMAAAGNSVDEAESNAIEMFQVLIDYSIENKTPLSSQLGAEVPFTVVPVTLEKGSEFFAAFFAALVNAVSTAEEWRSVPTTVLVATSYTASLSQT
ncbi:MAG: hypothetical protein AABO58_12000 [Acidobacteriota bacterium]